MMLMVLITVNTNFSHMMGDTLIPVESFVLPAMLRGAQPIVCKTIEDGAPFSMVEFR